MPPFASTLDAEGARVRAGIALLATMLEPESLHRALAENPAAATALAGAGTSGAAGLAEADLHDRRAAAQASRRRADAALVALLGGAFEIEQSTPVARILGPIRVAERPRVAILCSDVVGEGLAGPAIRALESARVLAARFDVQIGVRDATVAIDAPCPVRRLSQHVVHDLLAGSDAIVLQGPVSDWYPEVLASDVPIAVDLYDPIATSRRSRAGTPTSSCLTPRSCCGRRCCAAISSTARASVSATTMGCWPGSGG